MKESNRNSTPVYLGIDIGGTFIKLGLVRGRRILSQRQLPTAPLAASPKKLIKGLKEIIRQAVREAPDRVAGVGIGIPGLIRYPQGVVSSSVNLKGWKEVPLRQALSKHLRMPVQIDNDVNVMTLAEWLYGAGRGTKNLVCLTLGTGVGGGLVLDGQLFRSGGGPTGEIGHLPLSAEGPRCACGGRGCLERYVGNRDVLRSVRRQLQTGARSKLVKLVDGKLSRITPEIIDQACALGDPFARSVWSQAGQRIGLALVQVVNLLNPERIVIGGGIAKAGRWIFPPIRQTVRSRAIADLAKVPIVPAKLGNSAGLIGAAALIAQDES